GSISRIVPWLKTGAGVVTSRADVHYVVTEYGIADLFGKTVRERAIALDHIALPAGLRPYPKEVEVDHEFRGGLKVHFRPIQPTDERRLQELFYSHSPS